MTQEYLESIRWGVKIKFPTGSKTDPTLKAPKYIDAKLAVEITFEP
jgi:hypothetical protein